MIDSGAMLAAIAGTVVVLAVYTTLTAASRAAKKLLGNDATVFAPVRRGSTIGYVRLIVRGTDREKLRQALASAPSSFPRTMPSPDVRNVVFQCVKDLPEGDFAASVAPRFAEAGLSVVKAEMLVELAYDEACERIAQWSVQHCRYLNSTLVLSCTALELWLDARANAGAWHHRPVGASMFYRPATLLRDKKKLTAYRTVSGEQDRLTFEELGER